jgi:hypothetical protein
MPISRLVPAANLKNQGTGARGLFPDGQPYDAYFNSTYWPFFTWYMANPTPMASPRLSNLMLPTRRIGFFGVQGR